MKIEFSQITAIDDAAERLMRYINKSNGRFNRSKIILNTAKNIISKCFGHIDYNILQSNLTAKQPQLSFLNEKEIEKLKKQYLKVLGDSLGISSELTDELWMASYPFEDLHNSSKTLKLGQIGRYTYEWGQPDEYGEDTQNVNVYTYVIAVRCIKCKGLGTIDNHTMEENFDMLQTPSAPQDDRCDWCDGTGIFHKTDQRLNEIRLTEKELQIKNKYDSYYQRVEDEYRYFSADLSHSEEQDPYYLDRTFDQEWGSDSEGNFPLDNDDSKR